MTISISRNRDTDVSPKRWRIVEKVREGKNEKIQYTDEFTANNISFESGADYCTTVAVIESVDLVAPTSKEGLIPGAYRYDEIFRTDTDEQLHTCKRLVAYPDGSFFVEP